MASFEEAMSHGYSRAEKAADLAEMEARVAAMRCYECYYRSRGARVCANILENESLYPKCPYFKKGDM